MITRRDALRGLGLAALAITAGGALDGCGNTSNGKENPVPRDSTGLTLASSDVERAAADPAAIAAGVASMQALGGGLWSELSGSGDNLAISPYSVAVALGMTLNGARGTTLDEMLAVLSLESADSVNAGYNAVTQHVESLAGPVQRYADDDAVIALDAANSLFGQVGVTWEPEFLDGLAASYGAGMQQVDYRTAAEAARGVINAWVGEQTNDKIPELIPAGALDDMTRLVLVNTLYLKAPWDKAFEPSLTAEGEFALQGGARVKVPMMTTTLTTLAGRGDGWRSARLPYAGGALAMTVVLPDDSQASALESLVTEVGLADLVAGGSPASVALTMPRWTFRTPSPLNDALNALGMTQAFSPVEADFSAMTAEEQLFVSAVLQEVFIAVDEDGTEAAAATAVLVGTTSAGPEPETLILDRPFLFVIHDVEHGTPLFVGRVADPS